MITREERRANELKRNAEKLAADPSKYVIVNGVMMWNSNGQVPFDDMLEAAISIDLPVSLKASRELRDVQGKETIRRYIRNQKRMSPEQKREQAFERRAAFGPGETIVNIITGETTRT